MVLLTLINVASIGVFAPTAIAEPLPNTVFNAIISGNKFTFEIAHPETVNCSNYLPGSSFNCTISINYKVSSDGAVGRFFGNGVVLNESGAKVGYFGSSTFEDSPQPIWKNSTIYASMPSSGKVYLSFKDIPPYYSYTVVSQKYINLSVQTAEQAASDKAAADKVASPKPSPTVVDKAAIEAAQKAKKLTITCKKGSTSKKVTGESPVCPKGFTNPLDKYLTFQAFSKCQLYKKNSPIGGVLLLDNGKTLRFTYAGKYSSYLVAAGSYADVTCALTVMKAPSFVTSQIETTRALDGVQKATWGRVSSFWTYHPEDGLNISFNSN